MSSSHQNDRPVRKKKKKKKRSSILDKKRGKSPLALEKQQQKINESAASIQAGIRGHLSRKRVENIKKEKDRECIATCRAISTTFSTAQSRFILLRW